MTERDVVTWNLMIEGYLQDGQIDKVFHTCHRMLESYLKFDFVTLASVIMACVQYFSLALRWWVQLLMVMQSETILNQM
uniref:Pentatricopeptide repeat-containing protein n=1 Tax=Arundo donax TaxID=35708 RepID=A0A0A9DLR7_ARUDO